VDAVLVGPESEQTHGIPLLVVVTSNPWRFDRLYGDERVVPLVVPKPAWGWSVLDAIRGRLERDRSTCENVE
jgi:hypothetical protein